MEIPASETKVQYSKIMTDFYLRPHTVSFKDGDSGAASVLLVFHLDITPFNQCNGRLSELNLTFPIRFSPDHVIL